MKRFPVFLVCLPVAHTHFFAISCAWTVAPATICLTELPFALSSHRSPHWMIEPPIPRPSHQLHQQATDRTTEPPIARPSHQLHHRGTKCTTQPPIARLSHRLHDRDLPSSKAGLRQRKAPPGHEPSQSLNPPPSRCGSAMPPLSGKRSVGVSMTLFKLVSPMPRVGCWPSKACIQSAVVNCCWP